MACFAGLIEFTARLFDEPSSKEQSGSKRKRKAVNEDHQKIDCKTKKKFHAKMPMFFGPPCIFFV
jgi:hypothetical protein